MEQKVNAAGLNKVVEESILQEFFNANEGVEERDLKVVMAYAAYLSQIKLSPESQSIASLSKHPEFTKNFINVFKSKFCIENTSESEEMELDILYSAVKDINDGNTAALLISFIHALDATVRTNFFVRSGTRSQISLKIKSSTIPNIQKPHLFAEIFVYDYHFRAVHLRNGPVSRGGIRWSDRISDFRTEIMGLIKTQILKNCLIVPNGSKGGFVVLKENATNSDIIACYENFLRGLLDVTDNIVEGKIVHHDDVVHYDDDDPYLVVAADKGTASFSDYANGISKGYNFWLKDAFASGGSNGYNHKELGVTARGAWESVKRHFNETGMNWETDPITAIGIGSMNGDVFGNGMIYSENILLKAAFNHEYIFIDPNPDAKKSFIERKRLFDDSISKWSSYSSKAISKGGGVFSKNANHINLSPEMSKMFGISNGQTSITPSELIQKVLTLEVDLLWSGGIGTFIKASHESNEDVQDTANNEVRVNANQLRCKVIGEGANLSITQAGRSEYSINGGLCCTDAIDNSAGVDCSDHEVNIKILLYAAQSIGEVSRDEIPELLRSMEQKVVENVLHDTYVQTQAISSLAFLDLAENVKLCTRLLNLLQFKGFSVPGFYNMPKEADIAERKQSGFGFTKPEISVLVSHLKMYLRDSFENVGGLYDMGIFDDYIVSYFPKVLQQRFRESIKCHYLRKEIIRTMIVNEIAHYHDMLFYNDIITSMDCDTQLFIKSYIVVREIADLNVIFKDIKNADGLVSPQKQYKQIQFVSNCIKYTIATLISLIKTSAEILELRLPAEDLKYIIYNQQSLEDMFSDEFHSSLRWHSGYSANNASVMKLVGLSYLYRVICGVILRKYMNLGSSVIEVCKFCKEIDNCLNLPTFRRMITTSNFIDCDSSIECLKGFGNVIVEKQNLYVKLIKVGLDQGLAEDKAFENAKNIANSINANGIKLEGSSSIMIKEGKKDLFFSKVSQFIQTIQDEVV